MDRRIPWAIALVAIGGGALLLRRHLRADLRGLGQRSSLARDIISHPMAFGTMAGIGNGVLAAARNKPVSLLANVVTAAVIGISEGLLTEDPSQGLQTAALSMTGAAVGMAPFTRFDAGQRALIERQTAPAPA